MLSESCGDSDTQEDKDSDTQVTPASVHSVKLQDNDESLVEVPEEEKDLEDPEEEEDLDSPTHVYHIHPRRHMRQANAILELRVLTSNSHGPKQARQQDHDDLSRCMGCGRGQCPQRDR